MKKTLCLLVCLITIASFSACNIASQTSNSDLEQAEIVMIAESMEVNGIEQISSEGKKVFEFSLLYADDEKMLTEIETDYESIQKVAYAAFYKAEQLYEKYDEIVFCDNTAIRKEEAIVVATGKVTEVERVTAEYETYLAQTSQKISLAKAILDQYLSPMRKVDMQAILAHEYNWNGLRFQQVYLLACKTEKDVSEVLEKSIDGPNPVDESLSLPRLQGSLTGFGGGYDYIDSSGSRSISMCSKEVLDKIESLKAAYEAALAAEKGEVK